MKYEKGYTLMACLVAMLCISGVLPLSFGLMAGNIRLQSDTALRLIAWNELLNYQTLARAWPPKTQSQWLPQWQQEVALSDERLRVISATAQRACIQIKGSTFYTWCIDATA